MGQSGQTSSAESRNGLGGQNSQTTSPQRQSSGQSPGSTSQGTGPGSSLGTSSSSGFGRIGSESVAGRPNNAGQGQQQNTSFGTSPEGGWALTPVDHNPFDNSSQAQGQVGSQVELGGAAQGAADPLSGLMSMAPSANYGTLTKDDLNLVEPYFAGMLGVVDPKALQGEDEKGAVPADAADPLMMDPSQYAGFVRRLEAGQIPFSQLPAKYQQALAGHEYEYEANRMAMGQSPEGVAPQAPVAGAEAPLTHIADLASAGGALGAPKQPFSNVAGEGYVKNIPINWAHPNQVPGVLPGTMSVLQNIAKTVADVVPSLDVQSAFRSKAYNAAIYAARGQKPTQSQHSLGKAIDLNLEGYSPDQKKVVVQAVLAQPEVNGFGVYDPQANLIHFDVRSGQKTAWGSDNTSKTFATTAPDWMKPMVQDWQSGKAQQVAQGLAPKAPPADVGANVPLPRARPETGAGAPMGAGGIGSDAAMAANAAGPVARAPIQASPQEVDQLARVMLAEARGEGPQGMAAVGQVAANRLASGKFGDSLGAVLSTPHQFAKPLSGNPDQLAEAKALATQVLSGQIPDFTGGSTYFANAKTSDPAALAQITRAASETGKIGNHTFYGGDKSQFNAAFSFDDASPQKKASAAQAAISTVQLGAPAALAGDKPKGLTKASKVDSSPVVLAKGDSGAQIKAYQTMLAGMGLYHGKIDGLFGPKTEAATETFQAMKGLKVDGKIGIGPTGLTGPALQAAFKAKLQGPPLPRQRPDREGDASGVPLPRTRPEGPVESGVRLSSDLKSNAQAKLSSYLPAESRGDALSELVWANPLTPFWDTKTNTNYLAPFMEEAARQ